jgi:hypothetical protein
MRVICEEDCGRFVGCSNANSIPADPGGIAQYQNEANRLRRMAETEPIQAIRDELLAVARQYDNLAEGLKTGAPFAIKA